MIIRSEPKNEWFEHENGCLRVIIVAHWYIYSAKESFINIHQGSFHAVLLMVISHITASYDPNVNFGIHKISEINFAVLVVIVPCLLISLNLHCTLIYFTKTTVISLLQNFN